MTTESFAINFPGASTAEANRFANSLAEAVRDVDPSITVSRVRERPDAQDFGASLAIILGTASATAVGHGIAAWLRRNSGARIDISRDGEVTGRNLHSEDAARIVEAVSRRA